MKLRKTFLLFVLFAAVPAFAQAQLAVKSIGIGTGIDNGSLKNEGVLFDSDVATLYCLTTISGAKNNPTVKHVWYYNDEEKSSSSLVVRSANFKTWSSKKVWHTWVGKWRVDVVDKNGKVLASKSFTIK
ncbi:MAG: DUF2914 domain-containing protein [Balneolaceae bacterium]